MSSSIFPKSCNSFASWSFLKSGERFFLCSSSVCFNALISLTIVCACRLPAPDEAKYGLPQKVTLNASCFSAISFSSFSKFSIFFNSFGAIVFRKEEIGCNLIFSLRSINLSRSLGDIYGKRLSAIICSYAPLKTSRAYFFASSSLRDGIVRDVRRNGNIGPSWYSCPIGIVPSLN